MEGFVRTKRVTDPLDDKVKARLVGMDRPQPGYVSSGSEHDVVRDHSPCLSDLVHSFLEDDSIATDHTQETHAHSERVDSLVDYTDHIEDLLNPTVTDNADTFKNLLLSHVSEAVQVFSCLRSNKPVFRRNVMAYLQNFGHNAAICKAKWESSGGLTAGNYEFIDVVTSESATRQTRYFVDVDFAGEFEIARPTERYSRLFQALPRVFVGRDEELKRIVKVMCDAAKKSLKSRELHLPPWRKNRFMQMKWFGTYRRTSNHIPTNSPPPAPASKFTVKCRSVGFDAVSDINDRFSVRIR